MKYVKLGRTGLDVSPIALGCMSYGIPERGNHTWVIEETPSRSFIKKALDLGINFFDTANIYLLDILALPPCMPGNSKGRITLPK